MPKSLHEWLHYQALQWMMPTEAVKAYHGSQWHRLSGNEMWTDCGRWIAGVNMRQRVGFGTATRNRRRSPWWGEGSLPVKSLCPTCFEAELPLLVELERVAVHHLLPVGVNVEEEGT